MSELQLPFNEDYLVHKGKNWNVVVAWDQWYLGRCIVYLTSRLTDDLLTLNDDERNELWVEIMPRLVSALKKAFACDRINYAHLANAVKHVHWHIVPRYEINPERTFEGETFKDTQVGRHYAGNPDKFVSKELLQKIADEIKKYF